jgi:hypothetical protein
MMTLCVVSFSAVGPALKRRLRSAGSFFEIEGDEDRCAEKDAQVRPRLPVLNASRRKKKQKTHRHSEKDEAEPGFCIEIGHQRP